MNPQLFLSRLKISTSTRICIQIEFARPSIRFRRIRIRIQYVGETKRRLKVASTNTADQLTTHLISLNTPVSEHFLTNDHSAKDIILIPLELTKSNRDSVRKAREAYLIERGKTLEPLGINKKDEM